MKDTDFFRAMSQGIPAIKPPAAPGLVVTEIRMEGLVLGNADIEANNHEAIHGICAQGDCDEQ